MPLQNPPRVRVHHEHRIVARVQQNRIRRFWPYSIQGQQFLPQFLGPGTDRADLWLLAGTFAVIGALGDGLYALFAARARAAVTERARRIADRASGGILLGGAAVLLAARR